jgi:protein phosphatase PTC7
MFQSQAQSYYFNCPYQLSSPELENPDFAAELIRSADTIIVPIRAGDIVIAASDGVTDNVFEKEMTDLVQERLLEFSRQGHNEGLRKLAQRIARLAHDHGKDDTFMSPFANASRTEFDGYVGGKLDDVAVVCGLVLPDSMERQMEEVDNFSSYKPTNQ